MAESVVLTNRSGLTAAVFGVAGAYGDGWCGPSIKFRIGANARTSVLDLCLWLPAQEPGQTSNVIVNIGGQHSKKFTVPRGNRVHLQCDCRAMPGDCFDVELNCDHIHIAANDKRTLSFKMIELSLT